MAEIELRRKKGPSFWAQVDDEDYEMVSEYRWSAMIRPHTTYVQRALREDGVQRTMLLHSFLTGWPRVDHIDHNGLNNRRSNLRLATATQNNGNAQKRANTSSRFKGVSWQTSRGKWKAEMRFEGKYIYIGRFDSEVEAAHAYNMEASRRFGDFALLNELGDS